MKDPFGRTKVVLRHLPPAISQSVLMEQIDGRFSGRYKWARFCPGKNSQKNQRYSRAYIDFKRPEDVVEFAEFFDGHIFVDEKGAQYKVIVEYAPSQRVPRAWSKKDGREGTIYKDPEYVELLEFLAKPVENLPSAEIQLERREAEKAGGAKETPIVTPLMDFIRHKRARSGSQRSSANGKLSRRGGGVSPSSSSPSSKRGSEKRRVPTSMYVLRDGTKNGSGKDKSGYILVQRRDEQKLSDKSIAIAAASGTEVSEDENVSGAVEIGKRRLMLLKGKEREGSHVTGGLSQQQSIISSVRNSPNSTAFKQGQRHEASGRMIRSILSNKEAHQNKLHTSTSQSEQPMQIVNLEKDKRPPRPPTTRSILKDHISSISPLVSLPDSDGKRSLDDRAAVNALHGSMSISEKHDKRTRNRDRPDRGVWAALRRSDGSHASDGALSTSSLPEQILSETSEDISISQQVAGVKIGDDDMGGHNARLGCGISSLSAYDMPLSHGEIKTDPPIVSRSTEVKSLGGVHVSFSSVENGSHKYASRRGPAHGLKEVDGSMNLSEGKLSKKGGPTGYSLHERQIWVQKSGSGS